MRIHRLALQLQQFASEKFFLLLFFIVSISFSHVNINPVLSLSKRNKQGKSGKPNQVFRGAYGKLSILRSMCKDGEYISHIA